jgi:hypothetical protein
MLKTWTAPGFVVNVTWQSKGEIHLSGKIRKLYSDVVKAEWSRRLVSGSLSARAVVRRSCQGLGPTELRAGADG